MEVSIQWLESISKKCYGKIDIFARFSRSILCRWQLISIEILEWNEFRWGELFMTTWRFHTESKELFVWALSLIWLKIDKKKLDFLDEKKEIQIFSSISETEKLKISLFSPHSAKSLIRKLPKVAVDPARNRIEWKTKHLLTAFNELFEHFNEP